MPDIQFDVAEVLEYDKTYQYFDPEDTESNTDKLFAITVRSCSDYFDKKPFIARPGSSNIKQIPLVGEIVLIYKTFNQASNSTKRRESWYYLTPIDIQSSIHANLLPGLSGGKSQEQIDKTKPGKTFKFRIISPLQPYEGDLLVEGRWGNSIRFGSTVDLTGTQSHYNIPSPWKGSGGGDLEQGSPIIVLSNGRKNKPNKQFVVEDIQTDNSSLYLTSTQKLTKFRLNNAIRTSAGETSFNGSQFIGVADRITLKSKSDIIVLDSKTSIEVNTPLLSIGTKSDKEPGLHNEPVKELFTAIINILQTGLRAGSMPVIIDPAVLALYERTLNSIDDIDNKQIKQDKA